MTVELTFSDDDVKKFERLLGIKSENAGTSPSDWADRELSIRGKLEAMCPYERALVYQRALDEGYYPSLRKMAEALGGKLVSIARLLQLARHPKPVLEAIGDLSKMRPLWGQKIYERLLRDPDLVLARSKGIIEKRAAGEKISAIAAYRTLID